MSDVEAHVRQPQQAVGEMPDSKQFETVREPSRAKSCLALECSQQFAANAMQCSEN